MFVKRTLRIGYICKHNKDNKVLKQAIVSKKNIKGCGYSQPLIYNVIELSRSVMAQKMYTF